MPRTKHSLTPVTRALKVLAAGMVLALLSACASHASKLEAFRDRWWAGDFVKADHEIDRLIADESGTAQDVVASSGGLDPAVRADKGDTYLLLLEKGMTLLARGQPDKAVNVFRLARDEFEKRSSSSLAAYFAGTFSDDTALNYGGADYELVCIRVMLALSDLMSGGGDVRAYAIQIAEKQEALLGSPLGAESGYKPREKYRRLGVGAYIEGITLEEDGAASEAAKIYRRMLDWEPDSRLGATAKERAENGAYAPAGNGVLHVFHLAGRGPFVVEGTSPATDDAMLIARIGATFATGAIAPLAQGPVPVPVVAVPDPSPAPLNLTVLSAGASADAQPRIATESLLDVALVAQQQQQAWAPMVVARAIVRRAVKTAITTVGEKVGQEVQRQGERDRDSGAQLAGAAIQLGSILGNLIWTGVEHADTRCWSSLPAEIQAGRLELPAGEHTLDLGNGATARVKITAGRDSYLMVIRPDQSGPGAVLIDPYSLTEAERSSVAQPATQPANKDKP